MGFLAGTVQSFYMILVSLSLLMASTMACRQDEMFRSAACSLLLSSGPCCLSWGVEASCLTDVKLELLIGAKGSCCPWLGNALGCFSTLARVAGISRRHSKSMFVRYSVFKILT